MIEIANIDRLIKRETMKALRETMGGFLDSDDQSEAERQRQKQQAKAVDNRNLKRGVKQEVEEADEDSASDEESSKDKREDRTGGKGTADSKKLDTPSEKKLKNVTIGSVVDKLNALRGGRSLKDREVQRSFKQYFESLTEKEKQSMLVFLTGIAQILAGTRQGKDAIDPGDVGLRVKGEPSGEKAEIEAKKDDESKEEKTSQPIVVGESYRRRMKKVIAAYKKNV